MDGWRREEGNRVIGQQQRGRDGLGMSGVGIVTYVLCLVSCLPLDLDMPQNQVDVGFYGLCLASESGRRV